MGEINPSFHENLKRLREFLNGIIFAHVIHFELSQNDQNEQVQHHVLHKDHKYNVEQWCEGCAAGLAMNAVWWSVEAVVHESIPILSRRNHKQS